MDVFSAKGKMVDLVIDLNLPMSSLDKLSKSMIKLWFVPEILVLVREMSLKFDFWGRHACLC